MSQPEYELMSKEDLYQQSMHYVEAAKREVLHTAVDATILAGCAALTLYAGNETIQSQGSDLGYILGTVGGVGLVSLTFSQTKDSLGEAIENITYAARYRTLAHFADKDKSSQDIDKEG